MSISAPVSLGNPITVTNNSGAPVNLSGGIDEASTNVLTLAGSSATSIAGIANGIGLTLNAGAGLVSVTAPITLSTSALFSSMSTTNTLSVGSIAMAPGISNSGSLQITGPGTTVISGAITGPGVLAITGTNGTVTLSGSSNWSGGTQLTAGTLNVTNQYALGTGPVQSNTDELLVYTSIHLSNSAGMNISNTFYLSGNGNAGGDTTGSLYGQGPGLLQNDSGNNILSGGTLGLIQNSGNTTVKVNAGSLDIQDPVTLNTSFEASSRDVFFGGASSGTIDGAITDGGFGEALSFTKLDAGSWTLTNTANNFSGVLKVANGTLAVATLNGNGQGAITLGSTTSNESATLRFFGSDVDTNPFRTIYLAGNATIDASAHPAPCSRFPATRVSALRVLRVGVTITTTWLSPAAASENSMVQSRPAADP